jgi:uncharacterized protein
MVGANTHPYLNEIRGGTKLKSLLVVTICLTLAACATMGTPAGNEAIVRGIYDSFARGDAAAVLGAFDPQIRWMEAESFAYADRNPYIGPEAVAEGIFGRILSEWDGFQVRPQEFIASDDRVAVLGRYAGTYRASGYPVDAQFVHVWTIRNGKVTAFQQYADTAQFGRVMQR